MTVSRATGYLDAGAAMVTTLPARHKLEISKAKTYTLGAVPTHRSPEYYTLSKEGQIYMINNMYGGCTAAGTGASVERLW